MQFTSEISYNVEINIIASLLFYTILSNRRERIKEKKICGFFIFLCTLFDQNDGPKLSCLSLLPVCDQSLLWTTKFELRLVTSPLQFKFIYLGFYVAFNTVQAISRRVVGRAKETSTYSSLGFCIVNCRPTASNYQLSHLRP